MSVVPVHFKNAAMRLLTSSQCDIVARLEDISALIMSGEDYDLTAASPTLAATICDKILKQPSCMPQPCMQGLQLLSLISQKVSVVDSTASEERMAIMQKFLHRVLHDSLSVLWIYGEEHPNLATAVERLMHVIYARHPCTRRAVRASLFSSLSDYVGSSGDDAPHSIVAHIIAILLPLCRGLRHPLARKHQDDMVMYLAPLLRTSKASDQGSSSVIGYFGGPLCTLIRTLVSKIDVEHQSDLVVRLFRAFLPGFQESKVHSSTAVVTSISLLVDELDGEAFHEVQEQLLDICQRACASDFPRVAVKGLTLFQNKAFRALIRGHLSTVVAPFCKGLCRGGEVHWDADVRRATLQVWDMLAAWTADDAEGERFVGSLQDAAIQCVFQGDKAGLERYLAELREKVAVSDMAAAVEAEQRELRRTFDSIQAAVAKCTTYLSFVFGQRLGNGSFGSVLYAKVIEANIQQSLWYEVAVKHISKSLVKEQDCEAAVRREVTLHRQLTMASRGKHVAPLFHIIDDARYWYLVLHYFKHGDLFDAMAMDESTKHRRQGSSGDSATFKVFAPWFATILRCVGEAVSFVHNQGVFYGDLKPENVLIAPSRDTPGGFSVALCDFGAAMYLQDVSMSAALSGTTEYCAPELLDALLYQKTVSKQRDDGQHPVPIDGALCDAWSFGCLCAQVCSGDVPFAGVSPEEVLSSIRNNDLRKSAVSQLPRIVQALLAPDPLQRCLIKDALQDPWFHPPQESVVVPHHVLGGSVVTRCSGRRESMMWKRANIQDIRVHGTALTGVLTALDEEDVDDAVAAVEYDLRTIPVGGNTAPAKTKSAAGVMPYMTVMPTRRT